MLNHMECSSKSIEFNENEIKNLDQISDALFYNENDPRCITYKRTLIRPKIQWNKIFQCTVGPMVLTVLGCWLLKSIDINIRLSVLGLSILWFAYILSNLKRILICLIQIYQSYAPDSIRKKCRFEPSCSQYMISVIGKYGVLKGVARGIKRLQRCNINHGGFDLP